MWRVLIILNVLLGYCSSLNTSIELVHVVFRHGSRTPNIREVCPNNIHMDLWRKIGFSQLTTIGKQESYKLGTILRNRYKDFFPNHFEPDFIKTQCTDKDRTKMTALYVLSGLFSTTPDVLSSQRNISDLYHFLPYNQDYELRHLKLYCPAFVSQLKELNKSIEHAIILNEYQNTMEVLSQQCGLRYYSTLDALYVHHSIFAQKYMNLTILKWEDDISDSLDKMTSLRLHLENYNMKLKKLNGGRLFKKILQNMKRKSLNTLSPLERKMFLYSAHEITVASTLAVLGLFKPHYPVYNSAVIIELHRDWVSNKYIVKIFYLKDVNSDLEELVIEGCTTLCELSRLESIIQPLIPRNYTKECDSDVFLN